MGLRSPKLTEARPVGGLVDSVELWKRLVEASVERQSLARARGAAIQISISPILFVYLFLLGLPIGPFGPVALVLLVLSVLLAQELPRALFARSLGRSATISVSHHGTDTEVTGAPLCGGTALTFAALGSAANLAVAVAAAVLAWKARGPLLSSGLLAAALMHAVWGLAQVLPTLPFRAGSAISTRLGPSGRFAHALASVVFVVLGAVAARAAGKYATVLLPLAILAALAAFWSLFQAHGETTDERNGIRIAAEKAEMCLLDGDPKLASELASNAIGPARMLRSRVRLQRILAWSAIGQQDPFAAHQAIERLPPDALDVHLVASYLASCNRVDEAVLMLERARELGLRSAETTKLLLDLYFRRGDHVAVRALANADRELLLSADFEAVETALLAASA